MSSKSSKPTKQETNTLIKALEKDRKSRVIVYMTGDKPPVQHFATVIASDILSKFKKILKSIGHTKKISLAIYTNGGNLETPWPLVNLIREHCDEFEVIVIEKSLSAGTLIALGADKIVMTPYSYLSPIDPATNVQDQNNKQKHIEIEDITGYIDFVKEKIGITEQGALCEIMKDLTKEVPPSLLGSINRTHSLVRRLAKNLLALHKEKVPERQSKEIIEHLVQKLFSHKHLISRKEAQQIGFDNLVVFSNKTSEKIIEDLTDSYLEYLEIETDFDPADILGKETKKEIVLNRALVHSSKEKFDFQSRYMLQKIKDPQGNEQIAFNVLSNKWVKI
jgi:ATP-dependent protease ClpP protease subunit